MAINTAEVFRFAVIGIAATTVHYAVLLAGVEFAGINPVMMTPLAFGCAVVVTYLGQSFWVFRVGHHDRAQLVRFTVSVLAGLAGNVAIMAAAVNLMRFDYTVGFVAGLILVPISTYFLNRRWVFAK